MKEVIVRNMVLSRMEWSDLMQKDLEGEKEVHRCDCGS